jgi:ribonuclease PH
MSGSVSLRADGRRPDELRPLQARPGFLDTAAGSVLIEAGRTMVLCTASIEPGVPPFLLDPVTRQATRGWLTAEYNMLPASTAPRKARERSKLDGRTTEIQRLIGRSLRAVVDFEALGARTITIDCDVLRADGGTRTLSITGAWIALALAAAKVAPSPTANPETPARPIVKSHVAAVSVGLAGEQALLDLDYSEDHRADVDMNVVMTGAGHFVEVQGTAEGEPYTRGQLDELLGLAERGIGELIRFQRETLERVKAG